MISYGNDFEYANERLSDTVVLKDGELVYIHSVDYDGSVVYGRIGSDDLFRDDIKEFDLTPFPLGYLNLETRTKYLMRPPTRQYKQGLRLNLLDLSWKPSVAQSLAECVNNSYPGFESVLEEVYNEEWSSRAFHRRYALFNKDKRTKNLHLFYKDLAVVGLFNIKTEKIELDHNFKFLEEDLKEASDEANIRIV